METITASGVKFKVEILGNRRTYQSLPQQGFNFLNHKVYLKHTFWFIFFDQLQCNFCIKFNSSARVTYISREHTFQHTMLKTL